jgi:hypothetical protein
MVFLSLKCGYCPFFTARIGPGLIFQFVAGSYPGGWPKAFIFEI